VKFFKENNKRVRYLEKEEIPRLINNCCEYLKGIVIIAVNTGMRRGEIFNIKWQDIDLNNGIIYIRNSKSGEKREIPINEAVKRAFINIRKHPDSSYVFYKLGGNPRRDIRKTFLQALKKSGIVGFRFHDLRHTFASQLVMSGVDLNTVRELLGHKTIQMTLRYSHLSCDHKKRAVDALSRQIDTYKTPKPKSSVFNKFDFSHNILKHKELV
jgi:integrase